MQVFAGPLFRNGLVYRVIIATDKKDQIRTILSNKMLPLISTSQFKNWKLTHNPVEMKIALSKPKSPFFRISDNTDKLDYSELVLT